MIHNTAAKGRQNHRASRTQKTRAPTATVKKIEQSQSSKRTNKVITMMIPAMAVMMLYALQKSNLRIYRMAR